jgi:hypothetical protein
MARAADLLGRRYTLTSTNVPYLLRRRQGDVLGTELERRYELGCGDIATAFFLRSLQGGQAGSCALVLPSSWTATQTYESLREYVLRQHRVSLLARLGAGAFRQISGEVVNVGLVVASGEPPGSDSCTAIIDVSDAKGAEAKAVLLRTIAAVPTRQFAHLEAPNSRIMQLPTERMARLSTYCHPYQGTTTGDNSRWTRQFCELSELEEWMHFQGAVDSPRLYGGRRTLLWWGDQGRCYEQNLGARLQGQDAWGRAGVAVAQMGDLYATLFTGGVFDMNSAVLIPFQDRDLPAIWAFCSSPDYRRAVRQLDGGIKVTNATLGQVPFDIDHWRRIAEEAGPLPEPWSDDPTQWLFEGRPEVSTAPLQVAVARLLGYRWPEQPESDDLDTLADADGIVCLPSVAGEPPAADRLQRLLAVAYGEAWSAGKAKELLEQAESKKRNLDGWLRDEFFKQHCALFDNRPFLWHIWDGQRDGFSALVNYHRLDRQTLEKLTYSYLGQDWVERQKAAVRDDVPGSEARLAAALELQRKLGAILEGEKPFDIYVRWKQLHEQPIGWEPDLSDGVRLNIRPFVEADVLRAPFNIHWKKDRGKNPDGSERFNDIHLSLTEKLEARKKAGQT